MQEKAQELVIQGANKAFNSYLGTTEGREQESRLIKQQIAMMKEFFKE